MRGTIAGIIVLVTLAVAWPASAQPGSEGPFYVTGTTPLTDGGYVTRRTRVDFGTLNPSKPENAAATLELLNKTAKRVCTPLGLLTYSLKAKIEKCQKGAVADAVRTLDVPEVTRLARDTH